MLSKDHGFPADDGDYNRLIDADKMCISSFSHGLQSSVLSLPVHPTPGAKSAAWPDQGHLKEGTEYSPTPSSIRVGGESTLWLSKWYEEDQLHNELYIISCWALCYFHLMYTLLGSGLSEQKSNLEGSDFETVSRHASNGKYLVCTYWKWCVSVLWFSWITLIKTCLRVPYACG